MAVNVTLQIPNSVYRLAQITAKITSRPIEQVLSDVLSAANPLKRTPTLCSSGADMHCHLSSNYLIRDESRENFHESAPNE